MDKFLCIRMGLNFGEVDKTTIPNYMNKVLDTFFNFTFKSIKNQTMKDFKIVIIYGDLLNDIHKMRLKSTIKYHGFDIIFVRDKRKFFEQFKGTDIATFRLDADDYMHPDCMRKIYTSMYRKLPFINQITS